MPPVNGFNESHRRRLLANAQYADRLISDIEEILGASEFEGVAGLAAESASDLARS